MSAQPRAAIHLAAPTIANQLKACFSRAKALGCRVVAITDAEGILPIRDDQMLDRLVEGEFDLVILRAAVTAFEAEDALAVAPVTA